MADSIEFSGVDLILHVSGNGTEENVYRKKEANQDVFYNSYSHVGLSKNDNFWSGREDRFESWTDFWEDFTDLEEWWYFYKPVNIHNDYKDFILRELLEVTENNKNLKDRGNITKWREMCLS